MKVARLHGRRDIRLHEEPAPEPAADELLLRVTAVGLCGSDRHWYEEAGIGDAHLTAPLILGHEFAAVVEAGQRQGQRVAADPAIPCGRCGVCRTGLPNLCPDLRFAGHGSTDGALRTLMTWPARLCHLLPEAISNAEGALLEPLGVALHALDLGRPRPAGRVGVFGCGPIGLMLVSLLRAMDQREIVATDRLAHRASAAEAMGATNARQVADDSEAADLGLDVAFEVAGDDAAVEHALRAVRPGGRVVLVGIPADDRTSFRASLARRKGLTILLSRRMQPGDLPRAISLAADGAVDLGALVTERFPLREVSAAFDALAAWRGLKTPPAGWHCQAGD